MLTNQTFSIASKFVHFRCMDKLPKVHKGNTHHDRKSHRVQYDARKYWDQGQRLGRAFLFGRFSCIRCFYAIAIEFFGIHLYFVVCVGAVILICSAIGDDAGMSRANLR